jgi:hypothetical protein
VEGLGGAGTQRRQARAPGREQRCVCICHKAV